MNRDLKIICAAKGFFWALMLGVLMHLSTPGAMAFWGLS